MRFIILLLALTTAVSIRATDPVTGSRSGDWLLVNGLVVLQIADDGVMTLRNTGVSGKLVVAADGSFTWEVPEQPVAQGKFEKDRLFLKNDLAGAPKWIQNLEFKKADKETAGEVIEMALRQQTSALNAMAKVREKSLTLGVLNNLRQLAAAADQHFLENGTTKASFDQLVGPDKYIKKIEPLDGEDYSKLDLNQDSNEFKIVTASGIVVTYER